MLRRGRRWGLEFGRHGIYVVVFRVERHGSRSLLRLDGLDHAVFVWRILLRLYMPCAIASPPTEGDISPETQVQKTNLGHPRHPRKR